jgi:hypothetical protein
MDNILGHLHLVLNHLPIIIMPLAALILFIGTKTHTKAYITLGLYLGLAAGVCAIPAYLTGEPAEEVVEEVAGVVESSIEAHEDAATMALILGILVSIISAVLLLAKKDNAAFTTSHSVALASMLISSALLGWTGYEGGKIRHSEFYGGAAVNSAESHQD